MKKVFYILLASLFILSLQNISFAKKNTAQNLSSKNIMAKVKNVQAKQQKPLPKGFEEAEEIYFRQRIDLSGLVETQNPKKLNFFKLKLESAKTYSMIDLATMQESASKKTFFTWQDLNGQYGYKFSFEIVKDKEQYLFITIEPFAKEGKDIAYAYAAFYLNQKVITFEAMAYEDSPYKGFIKKILEIK